MHKVTPIDMSQDAVITLTVMERTYNSHENSEESNLMKYQAISHLQPS